VPGSRGTTPDSKALVASGGLRLGYACVNTQLPSAARTVRLANATDERLRELTAANLDALEANLVPFASHPVNRIDWRHELSTRFEEVGALAGRLSTHPGQYTVLSSSKPEVVDAAVAELEYHDRLLSAFGLDRSHKVVLHVGSAERFEAGFGRLSEGARSRIVLENDERVPLDEVLAIAERIGAPVVVDVFHHRLAPSLRGLTTRDLVLRAAVTWTPADGRQKIHFSTQAPGRRRGAHADTLDAEAFRQLVADVGDLPLDCMLEVKDKERSVLRAQELMRSASTAAA
jgi:UV DNA damage endonuclease